MKALNRSARDGKVMIAGDLMQSTRLRVLTGSSSECLHNGMGRHASLLTYSALLILCSMLAGCGGSNSSPPPPPPADFSISASPSDVTLGLGSNQTVILSAKSMNGFIGNISVSV